MQSHVSTLFDLVITHYSRFAVRGRSSSSASIRSLDRSFVRCFFLAKWLVCLFLFPPTVSRSVYLHSPSLAKQIEREENQSSELQNPSTS